MVVFTGPQRTLLFELLGLFQGGTFDWIDYNTRVGGVLTSVPIQNRIDFDTAVSLVNSTMTTIEGLPTATDDRQARIVAILDEYSEISLDTIEVGTGGGGGSAGARYSTRKQTRHLKRLLQTHLGIRVRAIGAGQGSLDEAIRARNIPISRG